MSKGGVASPGVVCRECGWRAPRGAAEGARCPECRSPRLLSHSELFSLSIAHIDCDAFYASVEKRDRPELRDKPLIIGGGGDRGVVTTACYLARIHGVRSAMPMVQARKLCPQAAIVRPEMEKYVAVSKLIRTEFESLTPKVEPLSLDEAFLDLTGTERLHGKPPAAALSALAARIEREIGVTVSVGLSWNKFLAKVASDLDKPRGFAVIGRAETQSFLDPQPVKIIWGVGAAMERKLHADGFRTVGDLRRADPTELARAYGAMGARLAQLSRGQDARLVSSRAGAKTLSAETTFSRDLTPDRPEDLREMDAALWRLAERVSARMKAKGLLGKFATLALKTADHKRLTRRRTLSTPTAMADPLYRTARALFDAEILKLKGARPQYRLIGLGYGDLVATENAQNGDNSAEGSSHPHTELQTGFGDLLEEKGLKNEGVEKAMDKVRQRFGDDAVQKGRGFRRTHSS